MKKGPCPIPDTKDLYSNEQGIGNVIGKSSKEKSASHNSITFVFGVQAAYIYLTMYEIGTDSGT